MSAAADLVFETPLAPENEAAGTDLEVISALSEDAAKTKSGKKGKIAATMASILGLGASLAPTLGL